MTQESIRQRLELGNQRWQQRQDLAALREYTARHGQQPFAIVVACSDSRVIPEQIFDAELGELFVIRVAGNVLDKHQLGSIEYAAGHLHCRMIPLRACEKNVLHGVEILRREFADHPEIPAEGLEIRGAVYDIESGALRWL